MNKLYDRIIWYNNTTPALNQSNLNDMSKAIDDIDDRVIEIAADTAADAATCSTAAANAAASATEAAGYASAAGSSATTASNAATTASNAATTASSSATSASADALKAEGYAVGKQNGSDVSSGTYYQNNAKYFKEQAASSASSAATSASEAATSASEAAGYSGNPPYIGANGNWYVWDTTLSAYKDSGVDASVTLEIADVTMLSPSAIPYVTNSGTNTDAVFHLYLPRAESAYECAQDGGYTGTESQFNDALSNFQTYASTASTAATNAAGSAQDSEAYAIGKRGGSDVGSSDVTYHNNSKWYSDQSKASADDAHDYMTAAGTSASNAAISETNAGVSASNASTSESYAQNHALDAEAWAVGKRNGTDVTSGDVTYENNSKFYAQAAETTKSQIVAMYQDVLVYKNLLEFFLGTLNLVTEDANKIMTENGDYLAIDY